MHLLCNHLVWRFQKIVALFVSAPLFLLVQLAAMEVQREDGIKDKAKITSNTTDEEKTTAARRNTRGLNSSLEHRTVSVMTEEGEVDVLVPSSIDQHSVSDEDKKIEEAQQILEELAEDQKNPIEKRKFTPEMLLSIQEYWLGEWNYRVEALRLDEVHDPIIASKQRERFIKMEAFRNVVLMAQHYLEKFSCDELTRATRVPANPSMQEGATQNNKEEENSFESSEYEVFTRSIKSQKPWRSSRPASSGFSLRRAFFSFFPRWKKTKKTRSPKIAIAALDAEEGANWQVATVKKKKQEAILFLQSAAQETNSN